MRHLYLIFLLLPLMAAAQTADTVNLYRLAIEDLSQVKVSAAAKLSQNQSEAPGVTSVISQEKIQHYGWFSANQVLYRLPGFSPSQDYDRRTVSARGVFEGWNNNHLLLLIDGVQFNDNLYGTAYTSEVTPLILANSLEVVRGPASALYGTNAVNGLVSINTLSPDDLQGNGMAQIRIGSNGLRIYDVVAAAKTGLADIVLSFNAFQTDGNAHETYDDSFRTDASGNPLTFTTNDERNSQYFFTKIEGKEALDGFSLQFHKHHWSFETGHGWLFNVPDQEETMKESRHVVALKYQTPNPKFSFQQEYTVRYQNHAIDWDMRYFPDGAFDNFYPNGVTEYLKTDAEDLLIRAQWSYKMRRGAAVLGGVEQSVFSYNGDKAHQSNIDLESTFEPLPNNEFRQMGPWFEFVQDQPVANTGVFVQLLSPKIVNERLQATFSLRYDRQAFEYIDIYAPERPLVSKEFSQVSPRIGLVFKVSEELTLKGLAGRAFRTPSPTEMFGANTYSLASNIGELEPEVITTYELDLDWKPSQQFYLQFTGFYNANFKGIIAYSVANANLSTNLYDLSTAGVELAANFNRKSFSGFLNYAYNYRTSENIVDETIAESSQITWTPAHTASWGLQYEQPAFYATISGSWQGKVKRRSSDITPDSQQFRPDEVKAWVTTDMKFAVTALKQAEFGILITNVLDTERYLIKNNAYRFDYRMPMRQWMLNVLYKF